MPRPSKKFFHCTIPDCVDHNGDQSPHYARGFCKHHYKMWQKDMIDMKHPGPTDRTRYRMFSACCDKETIDGKQHERGNQYCPKCKKPCLWRWVIL